MQTIRYGIIGAGMMAQEHIRNLHSIEGCRVVAIADPDDTMRELSAGLAGAAAYRNHHDLLQAGDLDALLIASPNHTHKSILDDVVETDLPILCEKPLCTTVEDALAIASAAQTRRAPIWVAMEYRYMPPVTRLIEEAHAGEAGRLWMLSIREHRFPFLEKVGNWNRFARNSGGTMVEKCCHFFDLMRLIIKAEPVRIIGSGGQDVNHLDEVYQEGRPDIIDNAYVIVEFDNGARANLDLCMFAEAGRDQEEIVAVGDAGKLECTLPSSIFYKGKRGPMTNMGSRPPIEQEAIHVDPAILKIGDHLGSTYFQHIRFAQMIRDGGEPEITAHDGAMAVIMGAAAEQAIATKQSIDLATISQRHAA